MCIIDSVILVEPSAAALERASHWITQQAQYHDIKLNIIHHACTLDELEPDFMAANINQLPSIHLLSNVLDMYLSVQFSMSHLCHEMKQYARHSKHYVYAVSPDFITGNKGFDTFHQLLSPQQLYLLFLIHISEPTILRPNSYAVFCLKKKNLHLY